MTKKNIRYFLFATAIAQIIFLSSCSTDVDLLEEYKPITVVYGLLNANENIQYIKVNKAFLGKGDALVMAQQRDSVNYHPGDLDVYLQKGSDLNLIHCDTTTQIAKDDGTFSNPYQLLFYANTPIDQNSIYHLIIQRHTDGATITSSTPIVQTVNITSPLPNSTFNLVNSITLLYQRQDIHWQSSKNGKVFNAVIRFTYYQSQISPPGNTDTLTLDYNLGNNVTVRTDEVLDMPYFTIDGESFFQFIGSSIPADNNMQRTADSSLSIIMTAGAENLYTYLLVNEPSIGLIQEKPSFTNITNGVGIFSSRWKKIHKNKMSAATLFELKNGPYTGQLF